MAYGQIGTMMKLWSMTCQQWKGAGILSEVNFIEKVGKKFSAAKKYRYI